MARRFRDAVQGSFASLIAPGLCRICDLPLLEARRYPVCMDCLAAAATAEETVLCSRCGESLGMESARAAALAHHPATLCEVCEEAPPQFLRAHAFGTYGGTLRELIHLLKYEHRQPLAKPLGTMLSQAIAEVLPEQPVEMTLVAVPLFPRKRPFNQSAMLAGAALQRLRKSHAAWELREEHTLLKRVRATESQFALSSHGRRRNVRGAFAVAGDAHGRQVLLIDDIYTTGATAAECTRVLLQAGAASVRVVTLARAQRESAVRWAPPNPVATNIHEPVGLFALPMDRP